MSEIRSILRATRTKDGGANAILSIVTDAGPINIKALVPPSDAEKLRKHLYDALSMGIPAPGKVARSRLERGEEPTKSQSYYETRAPSMEGAGPEGLDPKGGFLNFPKTKITFLQGEELVNETIMGEALGRLRKKTPDVYKPMLASAAAAALQARTPRMQMSGMGAVRFVEDEAHQSEDELKHWMVAPAGIEEEGIEQAAILSGQAALSNDPLAGLPPTTEQINAAKLAVLQYYTKKGDRPVSIKYSGQNLAGDRIKISVKTRDRKLRTHEVFPSGSGWVVTTTMSGDLVPGPTPDPRDIKAASSALITRYNKKAPGTLLGLKYTGHTPEGKMQFLVRTSEGWRGYKVLRDPTGLVMTAMSGDEVGWGIKSLYKKAKSGVTSVAKKGYKYSGTKFLAEKTKKGGAWAGKKAWAGTKGIGKVLKSIPTGAWAAIKAVGGLLNIKKKGKEAIAKAEKKAAERRAAGMVYKASGGKVKVPTPTQIAKQLAWAKAKFSGVTNKFAANINAAAKSAPKTTSSGSFARYELTAPSDTPGDPNIFAMRGYDEMGVSLFSIWPLNMLMQGLGVVQQQTNVPGQAPQNPEDYQGEVDPGYGAEGEYGAEGGAAMEEGAEGGGGSEDYSSDVEGAELMGVSYPREKAGPPWPQHVRRRAGVGGYSLGKAYSRSLMGAVVSTYTLVLAALRRYGFPLTSNSKWSRAQYLRALNLGKNSLAKVKLANRALTAKSKVNQIVASNGIQVQGKTGYYYVRRGGKWAKVGAMATATGPISTVYQPGTVPSNFIAKQSLVKRAFVAARRRHAAAIRAQNIPDVNYVKSNELATYEIRAAGLPTDQLRFSQTGTLLAGDSLGEGLSNPRVSDPRVSDPRVSVGDWDWGKIEAQEIESMQTAGHPAEDESMYDLELWIDEPDEKDEKDEKDDEAAKELKELETLEEELPSFDTTEQDLWLRSEVAGIGADVSFFNAPAAVPTTQTAYAQPGVTFYNAPTTTTATAQAAYSQPAFVASPPYQTWWNTLAWFKTAVTNVIRAATAATLPATAAAVSYGSSPAGGGGYGGGGGGGGGGDGGGGGEASEEGESAEEAVEATDLEEGAEGIEE